MQKSDSAPGHRERAQQGEIRKDLRAGHRAQRRCLGFVIRRFDFDLSELWHNGRDPQPSLGIVFVVTYGRSGSTLLTGILNSIPGYPIRGENRDAVYHLFLFHKTLATEWVRARQRRLRQRTHPFFGIGDFPLNRSLRQCRRLLLTTVMRPRPDTRVTGFKEIRWYHPDLEEYVAWLREVFPQARFLVNTRNHDDVLKSGWWGQRRPHCPARRHRDPAAGARRQPR